MAGQVQMAYIDPPYGVKFGSNFQPFVRKRDVAHGSDDDLTREPEMVKAYRDTWELGLHSYLTYLRDRLLLTRELLADSGSVFVQISDENLHHVREVMDEVFGAENFCSVVVFEKTSSASSGQLDSVADYLLWYAKRKEQAIYRQLYRTKVLGSEGTTQYVWAASPDGRTDRRLTADELADPDRLPAGWRVFACDNLTSQRPARGNDVRQFSFDKKVFTPGKGTFKTDATGLDALAVAHRLKPIGKSLMYRRYLDDFPVSPISNIWRDTKQTGFTEEKLYSVQTAKSVIERCMLMTTDPGDLVIDPTCGSGTTAYVAEQWGRRWITMDTSRVPLALARQRLLTASFDYYELKDPALGPSAGFVYKVKQNRKGEHVGGIVPHVTLKSIANGDAPDVEVLVDRPEKVPAITRVTGPFVFEATIPTAQGFDSEPPPQPSPAGGRGSEGESDSAFIDRMVGVLQASPILHLGGGKQVVFSQVRKPARSLWLSAEATRAGTSLANSIEDADAANGGLDLKSGEPVAIVFGPQHGAVTRRLVEEAWGEAQLPGRGYVHLYVIGFAIEPEARQRIDDYYTKLGIPVTYVQATPDVLMGDLLKNMRSSQIFSVCGQPDVALDVVPAPEGGLPNAQYWQVKLRGLDVFDPVTDEIESKRGMDVPAWFLDTDYNGLVFRPRQAFFPLTGAWDNLKRSLRAEFDDSVWEHLAGDTSEPFIGASGTQIAVKVIDHRGNELMVVRDLKEKKAER
jgi:adenine-specific DNA-methyltransferase